MLNVRRVKLVRLPHLVTFYSYSMRMSMIQEPNESSKHVYKTSMKQVMYNLNQSFKFTQYPYPAGTAYLYFSYSNLFLQVHKEKAPRGVSKLDLGCWLEASN